MPDRPHPDELPPSEKTAAGKTAAGKTAAEKTPSGAIPPETVVTADALRHGIDRGGAADKVAFPDPAAAPLGTDDEAAGFPPTREQVRMAAASELGPRPRQTNTTQDDKDGPKLTVLRYAPVLLTLALGFVLVMVLLD